MSTQVPAVSPVVVRHKVLPPGLPRNVVDRERLHALYDDLLNDREALAVFAAAGSGKTVQAQLFANRRGSPLAWLTLDPGDRSPSRLLSYLGASLAPHVPDAVAALEVAFAQTEIVEEVAAILAEVIDVPGLLIVVDQCETIADSAQSCSVLETFLAYLPGTARAILLGKSEMPVSLGRHLLHGRVGRVTDEDLALTVEEAESLLRARGEDAEEVEKRWRAARGWVAGVAFGGPLKRGGRSLSRDFGSYLGSEVLDDLSTEERQFLMDTSILDVVSMRAATALCGPHARYIWQAIALRHLPATTSADGTIVYHPCFRTHLREQLELSDPDRLEELRRSYADLLLESGHYEEAVELFISLGRFDEAIEPAERASQIVMDRGDWPTFLRWVEALTFRRVEGNVRLIGAYLRSLRGVRRLAEARSFALDLHSSGRLKDVVAADQGVISHIAWSMLWQPVEALDLLDHYDGGSQADGVRYLLEVTSREGPPRGPTGALSAETERLVSWGLMVQGRLEELVEMLPNEARWPPRNPYTTPHPLLGLVWSGELARARELFDQVAEQMECQAHADLWHHVEAWLLLAEGDARGALAAAERAVLESRRTGFGFEPVFQVAQAQALLSLGRTDHAIEVLNKSIAASRKSGLVAYVEWGEMFLGRALLLRGDDHAAAELLRRSVSGMRRADRLLLLPMAAIYLSEAERRLGNLQEAAAAPEVAYEASVRLGTFRALQLALDDCPVVLRQQLAANPSVWRQIVKPPSVEAAPRRPHSPGQNISVDINPFGPMPDIFIDGCPVSVRRLKILELAGFLALHPHGVRRTQLQDQLFPESDQQHGSNHFRQVVHQLGKLTGLTLQRLPNAELSWSGRLDVDGVDLRFERSVDESRALMGEDRLNRLREALSLVTGPYLPASDLEWASERRVRLELIEEEARGEAARLSIELGDFTFARECAEAVLARNPYADPAHRIVIEVELAVGSESAALAAYRRAIAARRDIGLKPDAATAALLERVSR